MANAKLYVAGADVVMLEWLGADRAGVSIVSHLSWSPGGARRRLLQSLGAKPHQWQGL